MENLRLREMVLYKHGVGFFLRGGEVSGREIELSLREEDVNDILKSLTVLDRAGGKILGIDYQTPMDKANRLATSSIRLSERGSQRDLLRNLRGRQATLTVETTSGKVESVSGRIIGIDEPEFMDTLLSFLDIRAGAKTSGEFGRVVLGLVTGEGDIRFFPLESLLSLRVHDSQAAHDLQYFLDTSMREDARRTIKVRLSEGDHDLAVSYVAPSPTWRVSYRLVAESDEGGESGRAILQGWGLFDNRLDEDLEDVKVTFVAGQPISFIYDLYASHIPQRPRVKDEARIAPGPVEYQAPVAQSSDDALDWLESKAVRLSAAEGDFAVAAEDGYAPASYKDLHESALTPAAEGREAGEFFQYEVATPVTVKRGESALVPIIGAEINYQRELLYNGKKLPNHPVAALRFKNSTGLTLERGPVTAVEDSDYKGEAVIPFTRADQEVYVPYAVELGVKVTERFDSFTMTDRLSLKNELIMYEQSFFTMVLYIVENATPNPVTITVEMEIGDAKSVLYDTPAPEVETAEVFRWRVNVPAHSSEEFLVRRRKPTERRSNLRKLKYDDLQRYLEKKWLDQSTYDELADMLQTMSTIADLEQERATFREEREGLYKQQEQLRENLKTLQSDGDEAALRGRMLAKLEGTQDRLEAIDAREVALAQEITDLSAKVAEIIKSLGEADEEQEEAS